MNLPVLNETFTSTGAKFFAHEEAMRKLRNGKGQPIVTHVMLTDVCNHKCAFCSVQKRAGDSLQFLVVKSYLGILSQYGLKAVILSGGGNPILYKCKHSGADFNDVVDFCNKLGLEIGLITNGMPLKIWKWEDDEDADWHCQDHFICRHSWKTVKPSTLDKLTWIRISMSGLDHEENEVYIPNIDPSKTTLGFSYVAHDIYKEPEDPHHGKVSRRLDLISGDKQRLADLYFEERINDLTNDFISYIRKHSPKYLRLLPNCLEPNLIPFRVKQLKQIASNINSVIDKQVAFVQNKPPKAPHACYLGYIHPVLNCDGYVYPCDSCVLNETAEHQFANPWRICRWDEIGSIYEKPVRSLIADPAKTCPGCVFHQSNEILKGVVDGTIDHTGMNQIHSQDLEHINFV